MSIQLPGTKEKLIIIELMWAQLSCIQSLHTKFKDKYIYEIKLWRKYSYFLGININIEAENENSLLHVELDITLVGAIAWHPRIEIEMRVILKESWRGVKMGKDGEVLWRNTATDW